MAAIVGQALRDHHWVTCYEKARQILDDLADIREDIMCGRLTFPVLYALQQDHGSGNLRRIIADLWHRIEKGGQPGILPEEWDQVRKLMRDYGGFEVPSVKALRWLKKVGDGIFSSLPGNREPLLLHIELKRAYLARLRASNFDDTPPSFEVD